MIYTLSVEELILQMAKQRALDNVITNSNRQLPNLSVVWGLDNDFHLHCDNLEKDIAFRHDFCARCTRSGRMRAESEAASRGT